jgi:hypothetical protein
MENLNAETIKKALECCSDYTNSCRICPYFSKSCTYRLSKDALALINSQEQRIKELEAETKRLESLCVSKDIIIGDLSKENERLRADKDYWGNRAKESESEYDQAVKRGYNIGKVDYVRAFAERLMTLLNTDYINGTREHAFSVIDQIAKEMLEENNG